MFVRDIFDDSKEVLGLCSDTKVYSRLTDAVEALANKGQWDSLLTYLDIATTGDLDIIGLPENVDAVLRININGSPSFARDRMWEFTLNGPGSDDPRIGFQWEDQGDQLQGQTSGGNQSQNLTNKPTGINQGVAEPPSSLIYPPSFLPEGGFGIIFPLRVVILTNDPEGGVIVYTIDGTEPTLDHGINTGTNNTEIVLTNDTTVKAIVARFATRSISGVSTQDYTHLLPPPPPPPPPPPIAPGSRIIRLSQKAVAVRALVRLKTNTITSKDDWIPLYSKLAILLMLKSIENYRKGSPDTFQLGQAQEAQALKFLEEEQKSRNVFSDLSKAMDSLPIVGYTYHSNDVIVVADIYDEASEICGGIGKAQVLDRISEAIEVMSNKGQWDGLTAYLDMVPSSDIVGLPRQVEIPLRININSKPSLARSRMFEFSTNGPGTYLDEITTLSWEDQGSLTTLIPIDPPGVIGVSGNQADAGKIVTVTGVDTKGLEQTHEFAIPDTDQPPGGDAQNYYPIIWKSVERIFKPETIWPVDVFLNSILIAYLYPDQTETSYRSIKLNKPADSIKILFRKSSIKITSTDDIIPIKSRASILLMLRALQLYKTPNLSAEMCNLAQQLEAQSLKFLQEEEQSKLGYMQASSKDIMPAIGVNTNSRGVLTAGDIYDDAADIFGPIGRSRLFDKITDAMELLANKSQWDGMDGYVDIVTDQTGYMTLPKRVEIPIGVSYFNAPAQMRSRWYEFNINGMQTDSVCGNFWDDLGEFPLVNEPTQALKLFATTITQEDASVKMRAYGYNELGQWIRSWENGDLVDGEIVPVNYIVPDATESLNTTLIDFAQVTRITKDVSRAPIQLFATGTLVPPVGHDVLPPIPPVPIPPDPFPSSQTTIQFLGLYDPDDTEPMFRRIKIPTWVTWVKMRYRTSTLKITKMSDPLNLKSKVALVTMMRAMKSLESGDLNSAEGFEKKAVQLISEEQMSRNPAETFELQYDQKTSWADPLQGTY